MISFGRSGCLALAIVILPDEEGFNDSSVNGDTVGDTNSGSSDVASDSLSDGGTKNESENSKSDNVIELPLVPLP